MGSEAILQAKTGICLPLHGRTEVGALVEYGVADEVVTAADLPVNRYVHGDAEGAICRKLPVLNPVE